MGLLDRFRAQPRWKNASPAIRLTAVEELPLDQQDTLITVAREDRDANVRIAALKKVIAPTAIAEIGRADAEERVREEAVTLLVDLATGAFEGTDQAESLAALDGLTDQKHVLIVARGASSEAVARAALDRIEDEAGLGAVARRATNPAIRLEALERIAGQAELAVVAVRSDFKDVSTAAVERLTDRGALDDAANRAKNKSAAKRARARVRTMDAEAAAVAARTPAHAAVVDPVVEAGQRRLRAAAGLCDQLEALRAGGLDEGDSALAEMERRWGGLGEVADEVLVARFERARAAAQQALAEHQAERAERARSLQANAEGIAARRGVCEQIDVIAGEETPARLDEARAAWAALAPLTDEGETTRWHQRFADVCRACDERYRTLLRQREHREKAAQVCAEAERLAAQPTFAPARGELGGLRRAWAELTASGFDDAVAIARFTDADTAIRAREAELRERRTREQRENLARLDKLCAELEEAVKAKDLTLKGGERALRDARAALDDTGSLPSRQDHELIGARLKGVLAALFPRIQELRDMDEWQRWANAGVQEELCQRVDGLMQVEDLASAARQLREAQAEWKQVATAPRDQSQVLWTRFKAACDAVRARCDVYFTQLAEEQAANRARKDALCQQAEALSASDDWIKTADAIKALQAEWKTVGGAPRPDEKALWDRFHAACDAFFTRRRDDLQRRKEEWNANLAKKEALCAQAEAMAETTEWQKGIEELKRLQAEWKTIGPVRKTRADAIWQRFRASCDRFFERYQQREHLAASGVIADAEVICKELEAFLPPVPDEGALPDAPETLGEQVAALRARWAGVVAALPRERAIRLGDRFTHGLARLAETWPARFVGTDLDPEANVRMLEQLCMQVEAMLASDPQQSAPSPSALSADETPATLLARQLRDALATNTIAGRQDDSAKWKAMADQVRTVQAAWKRVGPVPEGAARSLSARFQRACTRVGDRIDQGRRGPTAR
ncbi:MAG TPA: DUF349 domain-containing protein [Vicinamibacterales bacterium]|jgi:hypothetical protein